jgi:type VI protein secretion system component VasF
VHGSTATNRRYRHAFVGTAKRERQKQNRAMRQAEEAKAARNSAVKRNALRWVIVAIAAIAAVVLIAWIGGAFDSDDSDEPTTTLPLETLPPATTVAASIPVSAAPPIPATTAAP